MINNLFQFVSIVDYFYLFDNCKFHLSILILEVFKNKKIRFLSMFFVALFSILICVNTSFLSDENNDSIIHKQPSSDKIKSSTNGLSIKQNNKNHLKNNSSSTDEICIFGIYNPSFDENEIIVVAKSTSGKIATSENKSNIQRSNSGKSMKSISNNKNDMIINSNPVQSNIQRSNSRKSMKSTSDDENEIMKNLHSLRSNFQRIKSISSNSSMRDSRKQKNEEESDDVIIADHNVKQ